MTGFDPAVFGPPSVRVGTSEREQAAAALGEHFAAGRLDVTEYDDRVGRAYTAKTVAELTPLFADLPRPQPAAGRLTAPGSRSWPPMAVLIMGAVLLFAIVSAVTTHFFPFFLFPLIIIGIFRARRGGYRRSPRYHRM